MTAHSKIGASSMARWANCPGSVRECEKVEHVATSIYAAEGTVCHDIAAKCLAAPEYYTADKRPRPADWLGDLIEQDGHLVEITQELVDAIDVYLQTIRGDYGAEPERPLQLVEHPFHLKDIHPDLYGTNDCAHIYRGRKHLRIYDLKMGKGKKVEVEHNEQLLYYAMGALLTCGHPIDTVELVIVQPRCPHKAGPVRRWTLDAIDLLAWSGDLLDAVKRTEAPDAPLKEGAWCWFCPASQTCPAKAAAANDKARGEFSIIEELDE